MKYDHKKTESKWQKKWLAEGIYEPNFKSALKPFYNLMMFPYPSAEGLHVGNMYAFTGSDIYGRFKRMQGHDVFEPIGLDGFGIHSENYALKIGHHPADQAKISEKNFYRQLTMIGNGFAWNEKLETYDPEYYRWTQWIFIQLFNNGLAYRRKAAVNWCPSCLTVLADEQVIQKRQATQLRQSYDGQANDLPTGQAGKRQGEVVGVCERCETPVIKKELEQWFFRITKYAERLLKNLETIDWSERVKIAQKNWIGRSEGALIKFKIVFPRKSASVPRESAFLEVFTTRPDTLFGATFIAVSPELAQKWINDGWKASDKVREYINDSKNKTGEDKEKTGVFTGLSAVNPANDKEIPIWVADYILSGYGSGAVMCVPAHDDRDFEFAKKFNLPIVRVVEGGELPYIGNGKIVNSGKFNGLSSEKAKWEITKFVGGKKQVQYRLRDWLISRQRYWGAPIPMIYCSACASHAEETRNNTRIDADNSMAGWWAVPEKDLPVKLPYLKNFKPTGTNESPLAADKKFCEVKCPKCGGEAKRETDVSDTFLDSAWYYLGYLILGNPKSEIRNPKQIQNSKFKIPDEILRKWLPVDMYVGGAEHSVLHLLYVRFLAMVFKDLDLIHFEEPFKKFFAHGLIIKNGAKMSKSKGNVVNPDEYIKRYGADALRMYLMFLGPFEQGGDFRDSGITGVTRFLERVWRLYTNTKSEARNTKQIPNSKSQIQNTLHKTIKKVTGDLENLQYNTAISALMILLNEFEGLEPVGRSDLEVFLKLLAPFAPHLTEELWITVLKNKKSIHISEWPKFDPELIKEDEIEMVIQVNGKVRGVIKVPTGVSQAAVEKLARADENISRHLTGKAKKIIFVRNKLMNFVM